mgnify:CR=1 FL=1
MISSLSVKIIVALIALLSPSISYFFTKSQERISKIREVKLTYYKELVASLSGITETNLNPDGQMAFSKACNNLNLVASLPVIQSMQIFQNHIALKNLNRCIETHDKLLSSLLFEMRKDLGISDKKIDSNFRFRLWSSGV